MSMKTKGFFTEIKCFEIDRKDEQNKILGANYEL